MHVGLFDWLRHPPDPKDRNYSAPRIGANSFLWEQSKSSGKMAIESPDGLMAGEWKHE